MLKLSSRKFEMTKPSNKPIMPLNKQVQDLQNDLEISEFEFDFMAASPKENKMANKQTFGTSFKATPKDKKSTKTTISSDGDLAEKET
jgi:hypothetical protein